MVLNSTKGGVDMTQKVVAFGEIMMRLSPPGFLRFSQARSFDVIYGGGEANVAVSLANYGVPVDYVTRLPKNDLGEACMCFLRERGVGVDKIVWGANGWGSISWRMGPQCAAARWSMIGQAQPSPPSSAG